MKRQNWYSILQDLSLLGQFGFSLVTPVLLMLGGAVWLKNRFGWGEWVVVVGLLVGLLVAGCTFVNFLHYIERRSRKKK